MSSPGETETYPGHDHTHAEQLLDRARHLATIAPEVFSMPPSGNSFVADTARQKAVMKLIQVIKECEEIESQAELSLSGQRRSKRSLEIAAHQLQLRVEQQTHTNHGSVSDGEAELRVLRAAMVLSEDEARSLDMEMAKLVAVVHVVQNMMEKTRTDIGVVIEEMRFFRDGGT